MHEVLVNRLGGLSLPRKSVVRLTDRPDMTVDVYRGRKTTNQQQSTTKHDFQTISLSYHCTFLFYFIFFSFFFFFFFFFLWCIFSFFRFGIKLQK